MSSSCPWHHTFEPQPEEDTISNSHTIYRCLAFLALLLTVGAAPALAQPGIAAGGGHITVAGFLDVQFSFSSVQTSSAGDAVGRAHHSVTFEGELVEFYTRVTCMTLDPVEGRAWIGGVITRNNSTHPFWMQEIHEPGRAIWFRVVDYGEGTSASQDDRSTFVGFEGNAGIITSREYCDAMLWPAGDARTSPVTEGDVQVLP